jgi:hypothetical protein
MQHVECTNSDFAMTPTVVLGESAMNGRATQRDADEAFAFDCLNSASSPVRATCQFQRQGLIELSAANAMAVDMALNDDPHATVFVTDMNGLNFDYVDHLVKSGHKVIMPSPSIPSHNNVRSRSSLTIAVIGTVTMFLVAILTFASIVLMPTLEIFSPGNPFA